jgi:hypothetical protein
VSGNFSLIFLVNLWRDSSWRTFRTPSTQLARTKWKQHTDRQLLGRAIVGSWSSFLAFCCSFNKSRNYAKISARNNGKQNRWYKDVTLYWSTVQWTGYYCRSNGYQLLLAVHTLRHRYILTSDYAISDVLSVLKKVSCEKFFYLFCGSGAPFSERSLNQSHCQCSCYCSSTRCY